MARIPNGALSRQRFFLFVAPPFLTVPADDAMSIATLPDQIEQWARRFSLPDECPVEHAEIGQTEQQAQQTDG